MSRLFDPDAPLMRGLSALMDWFVLSFLAVICALPVFTAGASACALYGAMAGLSRGETAPVRCFFSQFRRCFRRSVPCTLAVLAAAYFLYLDTQAVAAIPPTLRIIFWAALFFFALCLLLSAVFLPPLIWRDPARSFSALWKTSLILGIGCLPRALAVLALAAVPLGVLLVFPTWFLGLSFLWTFLWPALTGFVWVRLTLRPLGAA